jgi:hypothetical protein
VKTGAVRIAGIATSVLPRSAGGSAGSCRAIALLRVPVSERRNAVGRSGWVNHLVTGLKGVLSVRQVRRHHEFR